MSQEGRMERDEGERESIEDQEAILDGFAIKRVKKMELLDMRNQPCFLVVFRDYSHLRSLQCAVCPPRWTAAAYLIFINSTKFSIFDSLF
jgi:hypothetical protein